jgi:predicted transcriptional regulator
MDVLQPPTKLERFIRAHHIKPAELAREAGCAREHLVRIRLGRTKRPRQSTKQAIAAACSKLSRVDVTMDDVFD